MSRGTPPATALPNWPALMPIELACQYTQLSESSFRFLAAKRSVAPVDMGLSVTRWRRMDLDALIDSLPVRGAEMQPEPANTPDPADAALERAHRRARR